jgi:hypothetical protein
MRRILLVLAVGAIMVLSSVSYAFAVPNTDNNGNATSAPGVQHSKPNCGANVDKQAENGVSAGGGKKEGSEPSSPANCDHRFNP